MRDRHDAEDPLEALERLAHAALEHWGHKAGELRLLKRRENAVYRVVTRAGQPLVLRVHQPGYHSDAALDSELSWIEALRLAGVAGPQMLPTLDGRRFVNAQVEGLPAPRQVDLQQWIDGSPLGTSEGGLSPDRTHVATTYRLTGNLAARLHNQATTWQRPTGFVRHHWDAQGLVGEQPLWGRFWDLAALTSSQRALLLRARDHLRQRLGALPTQDPHSETSRYGLIHADFVPENLLRTPTGDVRLIDFDDSGFGWHLFELATALHFIQDDPAYTIARANLIAGYREHRSLPDAVLADLPLFMAARSFTYLGWVHTRPASLEGQAITPLLIQLACREAERLLDA